MAKKKQEIRICSSYGIQWWLKTRHERAGRVNRRNPINRRNRNRRNPNHPNEAEAAIDLSEEGIERSEEESSGQVTVHRILKKSSKIIDDGFTSGDSSGLLSESYEEPNGKPPNAKEKPQFYVRIESHADCTLCKHKITAAMEFSNAGIVDWELTEPDTVMAIGVVELDELEIAREMSRRLGKRTHVVIENANCDYDADDNVRNLEFDDDAYTLFRDSFVNRVDQSLGDRWRDLYKNTFSKVYRVKCVDEDGDEAKGTAWLILREARRGYFLTCFHTFRELDLESCQLELIGSDFAPFKASILFCCSVMDFCLLKGDFGSVKEEGVLDNLPDGLGCFLNEITFGEKVFSISTPNYSVQRELPKKEDLKNLADTFWFPLSIGYVQHPWLVGMHPKNEKGEMMMLSLKGLGEGASGAPILNSNGHVIGLFLSAISDPGQKPEDSVSVSLRLTSIRDELVEHFQVPSETQARSFGEIISWVAHNSFGNVDSDSSEPGSE